MVGILRLGGPDLRGTEPFEIRHEDAQNSDTPQGVDDPDPLVHTCRRERRRSAFTPESRISHRFWAARVPGEERLVLGFPVLGRYLVGAIGQALELVVTEEDRVGGDEAQKELDGEGPDLALRMLVSPHLDYVP